MSTWGIIFGTLGVLIAVGLPLIGARSAPSFHPSVLTLALVLFFVVPKSVILVLGGIESNAAQRLLRNAPPESLVTGLFIAVIGYFFFSAGVAATTSRKGRFITPMLRREVDVARGLAATAAFVLTAMALVAGIVFLLRTGGVSGPSKRFLELDAAVGSRIFTLDYLLFRIALLSRVMLWACLVWSRIVLRSGRPRTARRLRMFGMANAIGAAGLSYYADNRAGIALVLLDWVIASSVFLDTGGRRTYRARNIVLGIVMLGSSAILLSRRTGASAWDGVTGLLMSRDLVDYSKVGVMAENDFRISGNSLWHWTLGFLPDGVFLEQNEWRRLPLDVWRGAYSNTTQNGLPPSLIGELYASGGWIALSIGMLLFGILVKKVYLVAIHEIPRFSLAGPLALLILTRLCVFGLASDFGVGMTKSMLDAGPLVFLLLLATRRAKKTDADPPETGKTSQSSARTIAV